ncbi:MAG: hypothetical protein GX348_04935 [Veillonellaceae bacterium]|jgi:hypothetical protein|nr:hypothetical protein [Veillonellaceae bacterium]
MNNLAINTTSKKVTVSTEKGFKLPGSDKRWKLRKDAPVKITLAVAAAGVLLLGASLPDCDVTSITTGPVTWNPLGR